MSNDAGRLHIVATPIGNLEDMSARAARVLADVALIAAEDTRHSGALLNHLGIKTPRVSLHEHNEAQRIDMVLSLVSDAGTPLISDPGYRLVRMAQQAAIEVVTVPGASSVTAALSVAGLPTDRFVFEGFLPARAAARRQRLSALAASSCTRVLFEAARRLPATLADLHAVMGGEREIALCRELTKRFETARLMTLERMREWVASDVDCQRGEVVLVIGPAAETQAPPPPMLPAPELLALLRAEGLGARSAARVASRLTGQSVNALYDMASGQPRAPR
jgi:16S rRNA (cytidine1402-2'-O)-methyltransferase